MNIKSPFLVFTDFLSPLQCENIVDTVFADLTTPDTDVDGTPMKMFVHHDEKERMLFPRIKKIIPQIEEYYQMEYLGTEKMMFEWYPLGSKPKPICDNSQYIRKKWARVYERDFSMVLFLCDYNDQVPFDRDYEVYGGKLEMIQHSFSFNPIRGTLVVYPSGPHFINATSEVLAGELFRVKINIAATIPYLYSPHNFQGDYKNWFNMEK